MSAAMPQKLIDFMRQHGYRPHSLKPSGSGFLRFSTELDKNGNASGFVKVFADGESGIFGDFRSGEQIIWHEKGPRNLSCEEREAQLATIAKAKQEAAEELARLRAVAAAKAADLFKAAKEARSDHPYLVKKNIAPYGGIHQYGMQLLVPVYIGEKLSSLQFIEEDCSKRFLVDGETRGGSCLLGTPEKIICVAEGYATACSIYEATGHAVAVAFNANNLMLVAKDMRKQYPEATLILCADNDQWTEGNPGLIKATEAAIAAAALLAVPDFSGCDMSTRPTDFNDLHVLAGKNAVHQVVAAARDVKFNPVPVSNDQPTPYFQPTPKLTCVSPIQRVPQTGSDNRTSMEGTSALATKIDNEVPLAGTANPAGKAISPAQLREMIAPLAPPTMPDVGFPPLIRDITEAACNSSEAHPVAVAGNAMAYFSTMMGRGVYQHIGDATIHCRPFLLIVGKSGKARKGTAEVTVARIFKRVESIVNKRTGVNDYLKVYNGSLSTGEGIAMHIRDARDTGDKGKGTDPGVPDKRMLVTESEFENVFSHTRRDNNNLSATIRNVFDGRDIKTLTKTDPITATRPHLCIVGHITGHELRLKASANDVANGLLNRFLITHVYRPKLVPVPEPTPDERIEELAQRLADALMSVTGGDLHGDNLHEVTFSDTARELWIEQYSLITRDREGKGGSLLARSEMYARMLAMIFAALDGRLVIQPRDLHAAFAWVEYWNASITYVFNCEDDEGELDPFVAEVLETIIKTPGITLTGLQGHWQNKRIKDVRDGLEVLLNLAPPLIEQRKEPTAGRPVHKYFAYEKK